MFQVRISVVVLGLGCVLAVSSCSSLTVPAAGIGRIEFEPLKSSEYEILGDAEGEATVGHFLFFPFGDVGETGGIGNAFLFSSQAYKAAMYKAVESVPQADAILLPRSKSEKMEFLLFGKCTVTVKGKAIKILKK